MERAALLAAARAMQGAGLNQGTSGNVSVRLGDGFLITPSALPYEQCREADLVLLGLDGAVRGGGRPSSEWRIHRDIYQNRPHAGAVLHCHSPWATTLACLERDIPSFHYEIAVAGGDSIRCAPYALFGSQELSRLALAALEGRNACLLAHHGLLCLAPDLDSVFALAQEVETLCRIYCQALQTGPVPLLGVEQMAEVLVRFAAYRKGT